ncbi:LuxR C-terminal-related transcriptional regulator [Streptomyces sp. NPDC050392]|uniref:helix-turn-helix transcriptional regulator n=1 Tax=Streptomyces sp. NPDC050392 TaxID=3155782 RepID=UPI003449C130
MQGRVAERDRMDQMLADTLRGMSSALLVRGEAGIGKTALLDYAAGRADGMRVLRVEGVESEMELAFGGLHHLFLPVLHVVDQLPGPQAAAMRAIFGLTDDVVRDRLTVGLAVLTMLSEIADERPLLCLIDDAQWLDQPSVDMLTFAARRLRTEGVVMVFAVRSGARGADVRGLPDLLLEGLDRVAAEELVADLPPYVADRIIEQSQGNPLALIELSAALTLAQREGQLSPLPVPEVTSRLTGRMQDAFLTQIAALPRATQMVLSVAAADDTGELPLVLAAAGRLGAVVEDLAPAERSGLVFVSGETVRFRHPLVRYAAYQGAPLAGRIAAHKALADTLAPSGHAHRRAWHLAAASTGPDEQVADELERVAEWAGSRQAMASASAAYERAAQLTAVPQRRARRLICAAQKASDAGQDKRCGALADQVPLPLLDPDTAADFARVRAVVELGYGRPETAGRILLECADLIGPNRPDSLAPLLVDAVHAAFSAGDAGLMTEIGARAPDLLVVDVAARLFTDDATGALGSLQALVRAGREPGTGFMDRLMTGIYCHVVADHAAAHEMAAASVAHCRDHGISGWLPTTLHLLAQAELALGRHEEATASAAEGLRLAEYYNLDHRAAHLRAVLATLAAVRGQEHDSRTLAQEALDYTRPRDVGRGTADALWALGLLELGLGRAESALELLESAQKQVDHPLLTMFLLPDLVEAAVRAGRPERAEEPTRLLGAWAAAAPGTLLDAMALRCRAMVSQDDRAEEHFTAAAHLHHGRGDFERARTELLHGEWLRRLRRKIDARDHLREALEVFERLGARPWARRARAELQAAGGSADLTGPVDGRVNPLSPQEREVVRLAATGATNREIATQLFLSPRTVGHHLYRAFPKLGISSRTELAELLAS